MCQCLRRGPKLHLDAQKINITERKPLVFLNIPPPYCTILVVSSGQSLTEQTPIESELSWFDRENYLQTLSILLLNTEQKQNEMAPLAVDRKRKQTVKEQPDVSDTEQFPDGGLDLLSGDEEEESPMHESDSDDVDAFPEINADSDTDEEEEESPEDDEDYSENEDEGQDSEDLSDNDLHIFPRAETVISDITGHPKKVYPEIDPDYDSDSSTENVRAYPMSVCSD